MEVRLLPDEQTEDRSEQAPVPSDRSRKIHIFFLHTGESWCDPFVEQLRSIQILDVRTIQSFQDLDVGTGNLYCDLVLWNPEARLPFLRHVLQEIRSVFPGASLIHLLTRYSQEHLLQGVRDGVLDCLSLENVEEALHRIEKVHGAGIFSRQRERVVTNFTKKLEFLMELPTDLEWIGPMANRLSMELRSLGLIAPGQYYNLYLAIYESLINALEHGNLGITYSEKTRLLAENRYLDRLRELCQLPEHRHKKIIVECQVDDGWSVLSIQDEGNGFSVEELEEKLNFEKTDTHGRGLFLIHRVINRVSFNETGNKIFLHIKRPDPFQEAV